MKIFSFLESFATRNGLLKILSSKRLLVDHLEILEDSFNHTTKNSQRDFLLRAFLPFKIEFIACILPIAVTSRISRSFTLNGIVASTSSLVLCVIAYMRYNYGRKLDSVYSLVEAFEMFDCAMKRYIILINELIKAKEHFLSGQSSTFKQEMISKCLNTAKCMGACMQAIEKIYHYEEMLEERAKLPDLYTTVIEPLEPIEHYRIFTQDQRHMKRLYHVFLYVQSHCLLRMGIAMTGDHTVMTTMGRDLSQLVLSLTDCTDTVMCFVRMAAEFRPGSAAATSVYEKVPMQREIMMIRDQSADLAVKLTAAARLAVAVDDELHGTSCSDDRVLLEATENSLIAIQSNLLMRSEDCERLLIGVKKLLNKTIDHANEKDDDHEYANANTTPENSADQEDAFRISGDTITASEDDFFILHGTEEEQCPVADSSSDGLLAVEELAAQQLMKRQFRPVLRQLRERLEPIGASFREREKKVMKRKGMELPGTPEEEDCSSNAKRSGSDTDDDDDVEPKRPLSSQIRYEEGRNLLASKQQHPIFGILNLKAQLDENILES